MTRLATFTDAKGPRLGCVLEEGGMLDLAAVPGAIPAADMQALIEAGPTVLAAVTALAAAPPAAAVLPAGGWTLLAPIPRPRRNVFCVVRNYMDQVAEGDRTRGITSSELPKYPQFFTKAPESVIGPEEWIPAHAGVTQWLDYEVELAAIIGTEGRDIPKERALDHVFGWTIGNDVTGRDLQRRYGQWFKGKSLDRSARSAPELLPPARSPSPRPSHCRLLGASPRCRLCRPRR